MTRLIGRDPGEHARLPASSRSGQGEGSCQPILSNLADVAGNKDALKATSLEIAELAGNSPSEIKSDVETLSDAFENAVEGDVVGLRVGAQKVQAALRQIATYTKDKCNLDLNAA